MSTTQKQRRGRQRWIPQQETWVSRLGTSSLDILPLLSS
jgi:hypothetical protein